MLQYSLSAGDADRPRLHRIAANIAATHLLSLWLTAWHSSEWALHNDAVGYRPSSSSRLYVSRVALRIVLEGCWRQNSSISPRMPFPSVERPTVLPEATFMPDQTPKAQEVAETRRSDMNAVAQLVSVSPVTNANLDCPGVDEAAAATAASKRKLTLHSSSPALRCCWQSARPSHASHRPNNRILLRFNRAGATLRPA